MDEVTPTPEAAAPKPPTPEETYKQIAQFLDQRWEAVANQARVRIAFKRGLIDKVGQPTEAGLAKLKDVLYEDKPVVANAPLPLPVLRHLVPLEGDTMTYAKGKDGQPRMAFDRQGFPSAPKPRGRKKPHRSRTDLTVKALSIGIFRALFKAKAETIEATCKNENIEFTGVPESVIPELGAQAFRIAAARVARKAKARRKIARRAKKFSRRVNAGLMPGNSNRKKFVHKGQ